MSHRVVELSALLCVFTGFTGGVGRPNDPGNPRPLPAGNTDLRVQYRGRVTEVTKTGITIKPEGDVRIIATEFRGGGPFKTRLYVQDNSESPRQFVFNDSLPFHDGLSPPAPGNLPLAIGQPEGHKIADVEVGDLVEIGCREVKGIDYCIKIEIRRRPGGKVPPARDEMFPPTHRLHSRMNTEQAVEEKIISRLPRRLGHFHP